MGTILQSILFLLFASRVLGQSQTGAETRCQHVVSFVCDIPNYETMHPFRNTLGHTNINVAIAEMHRFAYLLQRENCSSKIKLFLCSLYLPVCAQPFFEPLLPCRDVCEQAQENCSQDLKLIGMTWPTEWGCQKFNYTINDRLCVINNANETISQPTGPLPSQAEPENAMPNSPEALPPDIGPQNPLANGNKPHDTNTSICGTEFFDCRVSNLKGDRKAFCIDPIYVCDGKVDCTVDGIGNSRDEADCGAKCTEGDLFCDGKCIDKANICNGAPDCISGQDEQDCHDPLTGVAQSVMLISALLILIFIVIRFPRGEDTPDDRLSSKSQIEENSYLQEETIIPQMILRGEQYKPDYEDPYTSIPECTYERVNKSGSNRTPPPEFYVDLPIVRPIRDPTPSSWRPSSSTWQLHTPTTPPPTPAPPPPTPAPTLEGSLY